MVWNHRLIVTFEWPGEAQVNIHECVYEEPGDTLPYAWTKDPVAPFGENVDEFRRDLKRMQEACDKPVLVERDRKLHVWDGVVPSMSASCAKE